MRYGWNREAFILHGRRLIRRAAMVAHHATHCFGVRLIAWKWSELARHLGRGFVCGAGEQCRDRSAPAETLVGVVRQAHAHEERAEVRVAETQRAVVVGLLCDRSRR